jgi:cobalt-zinc-cadmium efflux system membrane fusion protein
VTFDQNKLAQISAPVGGIIQSVDADLGAVVKERQELAKIWSATIAEAVAKTVLSHQTLERERKLRADGIAPAKDLQEAEATHRVASQQARTFGFSEAEVDAMGQQTDMPIYLEVRAPFAGEITERAAVRGALVEAGKQLFMLVDRSTMWAMLNVPETALASVQVGQTVELTVDALPDRVFTGKVSWIAAQVDDRTRLAKVRAEVANADGALRDKMFAQARILTRHAPQAVLVPASAIQRVEGQPIVFVKIADDLFEARGVRLGATYNGHIEVRAGLKADDLVVVTHGFAVKSQLLISRLGAGCADD